MPNDELVSVRDADMNIHEITQRAAQLAEDAGVIVYDPGHDSYYVAPGHSASELATFN